MKEKTKQKEQKAEQTSMSSELLVQYLVCLESKSPYIQCVLHKEALDDSKSFATRIKKTAMQGDEALADFYAYKNDYGYYIPKAHLKGALFNASKEVKVGRTSMRFVFNSSVFIKEDYIKIPKWDSISIRFPNNKGKGRLITKQPMWTNLKFQFTLIVDVMQIPETSIVTLVQKAFSRIGIGVYTPIHSGEFGLFNVIKLEQIKDL